MKVTFEHAFGASFDVFNSAGERIDTVRASAAADGASSMLRWAKEECEKNGWALGNPQSVYSFGRKFNLGRT